MVMVNNSSSPFSFCIRQWVWDKQLTDKSMEISKERIFDIIEIT